MTTKKAPPNVYDMFDSMDIEDSSDLIGKTLNLDPSKVERWITHAQEWVVKNVLTIDTAVQLAVIAGCVVLGLIAGRLLSSRVAGMIEQTRLHTNFKNILHRLHRLTGAVFIFFLLFICVIVINATDIGLQSRLVDSAMRLTAAWIFIKISVKVIRSRGMRKFVGGSIMLLATLSVLGVVDDVANFLEHMSLTIGPVHISMLIIIKALYATIIMAYGALGITAIVERQLDHVSALTPGSRLLITKIVRLVLLALVVMMGFTMAGVNLSMLTVFSGAIGLGLGLGLQKGASNLFTGIMLLLDRTVEPGDIIELPSGTYGVVRHMGSRCTEVVTLDNRSHLIPNEQLVTNTIINWSHGSPNIAVSVDFSADYKNEPKEVIRIATEAAGKVERVLKTPGPGCSLKNFGDSAVNYNLGFWINDPQNGTGNVKSDVLLALWDAFKANNINIPFPRRDVYMVTSENK